MRTFHVRACKVVIVLVSILSGPLTLLLCGLTAELMVVRRLGVCGGDK
jgi:hypothetical protein